MDPNMGRHHMVQLLDALMYRVPQDLRATVMREVPEAYNAYCGREVVHVARTSDGRRLTPVEPNAVDEAIETLRRVLDDVPDHQAAGTWADMRTDLERVVRGLESER